MRWMRVTAVDSAGKSLLRFIRRSRNSSVPAPAPAPASTATAAGRAQSDRARRIAAAVA
jgi:hypothetical protein